MANKVNCDSCGAFMRLDTDSEHLYWECGSCGYEKPAAVPLPNHERYEYDEF